MAKIIIIETCEQCPHAQHDPDFQPHWGKWACRHPNLETIQDGDPAGVLLNEDFTILSECPLNDYYGPCTAG